MSIPGSWSYWSAYCDYLHRIAKNILQYYNDLFDGVSRSEVTTLHKKYIDQDRSNRTHGKQKHPLNKSIGYMVLSATWSSFFRTKE